MLFASPISSASIARDIHQRMSSNYKYAEMQEAYVTSTLFLWQSFKDCLELCLALYSCILFFLHLNLHSKHSQLLSFVELGEQRNYWLHGTDLQSEPWMYRFICYPFISCFEWLQVSSGVSYDIDIFHRSLANENVNALFKSHFIYVLILDTLLCVWLG